MKTTLSPRQKQVLECAHRGLTVKETAKDLGLSTGTVAEHWCEIRKRLGTHSIEGSVAAFYGAPQKDKKPAPLSTLAETRLSPREKDILQCGLRGLSAKGTGAELFLSRFTVQTHWVNIKRKLGARSKYHAIALATQQGGLT